jgi:hypothetical protein
MRRMAESRTRSSIPRTRADAARRPDIYDADGGAFRDRNRHGPVHGPTHGIGHLLASRSPGFPKKEVSGDENAVRQRCAVAEVPEQRNQRNQGTEIVGSATRRRGACPGGDALPGSHSITAFGLPRLACHQRSSYSPAPGSCAILASSVLRSSISRTSSKCAPRRHNPGTLISRRVCPGFQRARVDPLHAADPPAFDGYQCAGASMLFCSCHEVS